MTYIKPNEITQPRKFQENTSSNNTMKTMKEKVRTEVTAKKENSLSVWMTNLNGANMSHVKDFSYT